MLVETKKIKKTYGTGESAVQAIKQIDIKINEKEFVAVCGPSGSGKSTFLTILAGLNKPTAGEVVVDDISIYNELGSDGLANFRNEYIGFVFQAFQLVPYLTALENVMLPLVPLKLSRKVKREMAFEALHKVGLRDKTKSLPGELSGGQSQRVAIARAIVNKPPLILADEPTGNLDSHTRDEIMNLFEDIRKIGHTIIMVTHDPDNIKWSQKVIQIKDGEIEK